LAIIIQPYREEHQPAVNEFNRRLQAAGAEPDLVFYRYALPQWLPPTANDSLYNEYFVAVDGGVVRGGYALKRQNFLFPDGTVRSIGYYHHPLSEGIINKSYAPVGALLLRDAMQRSPLLYCLGMGGYDRPLPKMLVGLGWNHCAVPFYFRIVNAYRFLKEVHALRRSSMLSLAMDLAAYTGVGWAALKMHRLSSRIRALRLTHYRVAEVREFSEWSDSLWNRAEDAYAMTAVRDSGTLQTLYPASDRHFTRLKVSRDGIDVGWAVVAERRRDPKYGTMRVGSIVDCWSLPDDALAVVRAAADVLEDQGMELIVSNQSHNSWRRALKDAGFLQAESNFILALSKQLAAQLQPFEQTTSRFHFTRADGDGLPRNY